MLLRCRLDHLAHIGQATAAAHRSDVRRQVPADDVQQGRLATTIGSDEGDLGALADPEGHVVEQHPAIGQLEPDTGKVDVAHTVSLQTTSGPGRLDCRCEAVRDGPTGELCYVSNVAGVP